jgi:hypothetical protein
MKRHFRNILAALCLFALPTGALAQDTAQKPEAIDPDIQPGALWDGRKLAPFRAMDFPKMVKASEADFLDDEDYVLGFSMNGQARAYPMRYAWWHHIINDKITREDGTEAFVTVTY